ncbi:hypothetical protein FQR65_LT12366 [Abscondita terminalis]|nr:hypothetical protein FQR65_LT12366 [Abscondita terminalis]
MSKVLKDTIRNYCSKHVSPKSQTWYLMGTTHNNRQIEKNIVNSLRKDYIYAHRSYFLQYVNEAAGALEGETFLPLRKRFEKFCHYNGLSREQYTSWVMLGAYQLSEEIDKIEEENLKKMSMLAWSFESAVTSLVMADDFIDGETIRWKKPCWFRNPNIGCSVISDMDLLRMSGFYMIRKYFRNQPYYRHLLNLLVELIHATVVGQTMDLYASKTFKRSRDLNLLNLKKYFEATRFKAYVPILRCCTVATLYLTNTHQEYFKYENIFEKFGCHSQITNDLHDLFGKYESFGRGSSDIEEGKCSWVIAVAIEHANDKQMRLLKNNYGRSEPKCQQIVLDVYKEIDVVQKFYDYNTQLLEEINNDLKNVSNPKIFNIIKNYVDLYIDVDYDFASY